MSADAPRLSDLLQHREFLERFARSLARDPAVADDVIQETWLTALERPPKHHGDLRAWLRRVARNAFLQRHRSGTRAKPLETASIERMESSDSHEREDVSTRLASELLALPELYRRVLILRYYEDKTPTAIARELDRSVNTVTSQIARGLKLMQERLDRSHEEGRSRWLPTVLLLARGREREASASEDGAPIARSIGGLRAVVGLLVAACLVVTVVLVLRSPDRAPDRAPAEVLVARESKLVAPTATNERTLEPIETPSPAPDASVDAATPPNATVVVEVVGPDGAIAGASVYTATSDPSRDPGGSMTKFSRNPAAPSATDRDGRVAIPVGDAQRVRLGANRPDELMVSVYAKGFMKSYAESVPFPESGTVTMTFQLEPGSTIVRGRVTDEEGAPVEAALVSVGNGLERRIDLGGRRSRLERDWFSETRADGAFQHEGVRPGRLRVRVEHPGFVPDIAWITVADGTETEHDVVLRSGATVSGRATMADGSPAAGASVRAEFSVHGLALGVQQAVANEDGEFELRGIAPERAFLFAWFAEHPGVNAALDLTLARGETHVWNPVLEERPPLRLRVQLDDGSPLSGAFVALSTTNDSDAWSRFLVTDASGRARIELLPATDLVAVVYPRPADFDNGLPPCHGEQGLHAAAEELSLTVPHERLVRGSLRGVVLDHDGQPAANALVQIRARPGGVFCWKAVDATGAFEFDRLPAQLYDAFITRAGAGTFPLGAIEVLPRDPFEFGEILLPPLSPWTPLWPIPDAPAADEYTLLKIDSLEGLEKRWLVISGATPPPASFQLLPGKYEWLLHRAGELVRREAFEVR